MMLWVQRAWDQLSLYFPLILMGSLALATFWMAKSTPSLLPTLPAPQALREPDYVMRAFSVKTFDGTGRLKSEVSGAVARHFPDTNLTEIDQISVRMIDKQGRVLTAAANRAVTSGNGSEFELFGNAQVVREASAQPSGSPNERVSFQGEFLHVLVDAERIKSHLPVVLQKGSNEFRADSMEFDNLAQVLWLRGNVKGQLLRSANPP